MQRILRLFGNAQAEPENAQPPRLHANTPVEDPEVEHVDEDDEDEEDDEGEEDDEDEEHDLRYWGPIKNISNQALIDLTLSILDPGKQLNAENFLVLDQDEGTFHCVWIVETPTREKIVIKVPATGHADRWTPEDAVNIKTEALTMAYLAKHTKAPVPAILGFDCTFSNSIGAPYIMMGFVEGKPVHKVWYKHQHNIEEIRQNILTSLAKAMNEFGKLEFNKIGTLHFDGDQDPVVGPTHTFRVPKDIKDHPEDLGIARELKTIPAFSTAKEYYEAALQEKEAMSRIDDRVRGIHKILRTAFAMPPFTKVDSAGKSTGGETFVLAHADLDLQNVYVDDDGNVTGLIDFDGIKTVPRCVGSAVPMWLRHDWRPQYVWPGEEYTTLSPQELDRYRNFYAKAMLEVAGEDSDAKFTEKSAMFTALHDALYGNGSAADAADKVLESAFPRTHSWTFTTQLGEGGWKEGEEALRERLQNVLAC